MKNKIYENVLMLSHCATVARMPLGPYLVNFGPFGLIFYQFGAFR